MRRLVHGAVLHVVPLASLVLAVWPGVAAGLRAAAIAVLIAFWIAIYVRYRHAGRAQTAHEYELLRSVRWDAFWRHYNENVPTIEQEFEIWGPYHQHRHEMRYDLVAGAARKDLPAGGKILDVGCGSALVADRIADKDASYVGTDFGGPHIAYAAKKFKDFAGALHLSFARSDAAALPFADESFDVVVMSEVIEHLIRPELAVWEVARVLRPGGVFVMTTNNASEVPLRSPVTHLLAWVEKALGAKSPNLISLRPWVWPEKVEDRFLPAGSGEVYLPHTHHIAAQTSQMFAAAGLSTTSWSTFEFPPPHSLSARILERMDGTGRRLVDVIEAVARSIPLVRRLGTHLFIVARKTGAPAAPEVPAGVWPGPFSG